MAESEHPGLKYPDLILRVIRLLSEKNLSLSQKLDKSLKMILQGIEAGNGSIMIADDQGSNLVVLAATRKKILGRKQPVSQDSISGRSFLKSEPVFIRNIHEDQDFAGRARPGSYRTDSLMSVPLLVPEEDKAFGVINASDRLDNTAFQQIDLDFLKDYSSWISPILRNSLLMEDLAREKEKYQRISQELEIKQNQLMISVKERSELVQMVVHDFKSPLSAVISNLELLAYLDMNQEQKPVVDTALAGSQKLLDMINEFLELARLDQWQETDVIQDVSLQETVREEVEEIMPVAVGKSISLKITGEADIMVRAGKNMLSHLIKNLVSNGVKYTPEGGMVMIGWASEPGRRSSDGSLNVVRLYVDDSGPGIPLESRKEIFERFSRINSSKGIQGTGLGLYICQRIAEMLGGKIWVEDAPSGGSRFCVTMHSREAGRVH
ncbi:MAG: ATP-binding protein [Desulfonatronovibrionaceae bacterium]